MESIHKHKLKLGKFSEQKKIPTSKFVSVETLFNSDKEPEEQEIVCLKSDVILLEERYNNLLIAYGGLIKNYSQGPASRATDVSNEIIITMEGGLIQNIENIPQDIQIKVNDYDISEIVTDQELEEDHKKDDEGKYHTENIWKSKIKVVNVTETKAVCAECGSDDVEIRMWKNCKTGKVDTISDDNSDTWCNACVNHWATDMCACGSGLPPEKCDGDFEECGKPYYK